MKKNFALGLCPGDPVEEPPIKGDETEEHEG